MPLSPHETRSVKRIADAAWTNQCAIVSLSAALFPVEALLQKKNKMLEEALQLALKAQEKARHAAPAAWRSSSLDLYSDRCSDQ